MNPEPGVADADRRQIRHEGANRANLIGLRKDELRDALVSAGTPERQAGMRVSQVWQWMYQKGVCDFDAMTDLAKDYRSLLA